MSLTVKKTLSCFKALMIPAALSLGLASCNSDDKTSSGEDIAAVTISTVAVKNFNLKADSKVLANLDSVFFSIDLNRGVIFNADSLPKGTKISKLIPVITFQTAMSKAEIIVEGSGSLKTDTINYLTNANDSIDFSRKVSLKVTALDGVNTYTYQLKVNVHTQNPDSLMWGKMAVAKLPSRMPAPRAQKSVMFGGKAVSLIREADNTLTLSSSSDLLAGDWTKTKSPSPSPDVESLEAAGAYLYLLGENGSLYSSADGATWADTGEVWQDIIGPYMDSVLGIKGTPTGAMHCHYPASDLIADTAVDPEFPIGGRSSFLTLDTKWASSPTGILTGGVTPSGEFSSATWAFDGSGWAVINKTSLPALNGPALVKYYNYRPASHAFQWRKYNVWLTIGGMLADGKMNREVYLSYDNGVSWTKGTGLLQLPDFFPALSGADGLVMESLRNANVADAWTTKATPAPASWYKEDFEINGTEVSWQCPYIYIIGGNLTDGSLSDSIWRGVLTRLTFQPIL